MIKLGDKGLIVEYINYALGLNNNTFTEETEKRLKQFQSSYNQIYIDETQQRKYFTNPATGEVKPINNNYSPYNEYFKPEDNYDDFNASLYIYPNGIVDIFTLVALTDIDLENFNTNKIKQVQEALSKTVYNNGEILIITGVYDENTKQAIKNFQKYHDIYQARTPIIEGKNLLPNVPEFWSNGKINISDGEIDTNDSNYIISNLIAIDSNYDYYIKSFSEDYPIIVSFYSSPVTYITEAIASSYDNYEDFSPWFNSTTLLMEGKIPYCQTSSNNKVNYIRISIKNESGIIPEDIQALMIQLELNDKSTNYEPNSMTEYNKYYSGFLNVPTYNAIKKEFNLPEVD